MEVLYAQDPRPEKRWLWRGVRSPVGGPDSLFIDRNVDEERAIQLKAETKGARAAKKPEDAIPSEPLPADEVKDFYLGAVAVPIHRYGLRGPGASPEDGGPLGAPRSLSRQRCMTSAHRPVERSAWLPGPPSRLRRP